MSCRTIVSLLAIIAAFEAGPLCVFADEPRLDEYGFPLPEGAIARIGDLHFSQRGWIEAIAATADGRTIATAAINRVFLWNNSGRIQREIGLAERAWVSSLRFSSDGRLLAVGLKSGDVSLWNTASGKPVWPERNRTAEKARAPNRELPRGVQDLRFLPDDHLLAAAYHNDLVRLWDVAKGAEVDVPNEKLKTFRNEVGSPVIAAGLSPSGRQTAYLISEVDGIAPLGRGAVLKRGTVLVCDTITGQSIRETKGLRDSFDSVRLLDEGGTAICDDSAIGWTNIVVDLKSGQERFEIPFRMMNFGGRMHSRPRLSIGVMADGKSLVSADEAGSTRWDISTGKKLAEWPGVSHRHFAEFDGGKCIAVADGNRVRLCDSSFKPLMAIPEIATRPSNIPHVGRTPFDSGAGLFVYHKNGGIVVLDTETGKELCRLGGVNVSDGKVYRHVPSLSSDGGRVLLSTQEDDTILLRWFESRTGTEIGRHRIQSGDWHPWRDRADGWFSKDGSVCGWTARDNRLVLFDCKAGKVKLTCGLPEPPPVLDENGHYSSPKWLFRFEASRSFLTAEHIISYDTHHSEFAYFDPANGQLLRRFELKPERPAKVGYPRVYSCLSHNGRFAAIVPEKSHEITIYETLSGNRRGSIQIPVEVREMSFAADDKTLRTLCDDGTTLIWDLQRPLSKSSDRVKDMSALWETLGHTDATAADRAIWAMVRAPKEAIPLVIKRLKPVADPDPENVRRLIASLDGADFKVRDSAMKLLEDLGEAAAPIMKAHIADSKTSLEQRRRLESLVAGHHRPFRELRAIEVLDRINSSETRQHLKALAAGSAASQVTREAIWTLKHGQSTLQSP